MTSTASYCLTNIHDGWTQNECSRDGERQECADDLGVVQGHNPEETKCNVSVGKRAHDIGARLRPLGGECMCGIWDFWWALVDLYV